MSEVGTEKSKKGKRRREERGEDETAVRSLLGLQDTGAMGQGKGLSGGGACPKIQHAGQQAKLFQR
eukprot:CAMPEP_0117685938 /NCGR_PEP_ID=MMETSP0804-20121206/22102_1 /TAXON_ID=1074897 /ORGANISM="Tetraselmis astigmatica, Strain CCMP880" /LENGTH=65 /DNA_ID=CAMNT_0005497435 /DNA_START=211 /DNA_END=405 /DNA_ORIENTATION=-